MGLHFTFKGASLDEPGVIATLQEDRTQLARVARGFSWDLDAAGVHPFCRTPVDVYIDEWVYELLDLMERVGARRILIDSLADLSMAAGDETRFRDWMHSLTSRFSRAGISALMTLEVPELFEPVRVSEHGMSHLSDNVLLLQCLRQNGRLQRALTVLKTRAHHHDPTVRQFEITKEGITLVTGGESLAV